MPEDWKVFEDYCVDLLELSGTVASGSQYHDIGDGVDRDSYDNNPFRLMIDAKTTVRGSFTLNAKYLINWAKKAMLRGRRFAMPIRFLRAEGDQDWMLIPLDDFAELVMLAKRGAERE